MRKCNHCKVEIIDITDHCPLCNSVLEEIGESNHNKEENSYPNILLKHRKINFVYRLLVFIAVVISGTCMFINYQQHIKTYWSAIVTASLVYVLWMLSMFFHDDAGYRKRIFAGVMGSALLVILIDGVLGFHGWSVDFVLPGAMILVDVTLILLMLINRRNWQSYMIMQIAMILLGIVPLLLIHLKIVTHPLVSEIAFIVSVFLFLGSVILGGKTAKNELKRRFHI